MRDNVGFPDWWALGGIVLIFLPWAFAFGVIWWLNG